MGTTEEELRVALKRFVERSKVRQSETGTIVSVDLTNLTCTVMPTDGPEHVNVRLRAVIDDGDSGVYAIPEVDSIVLVQMIGDDDSTAYVSQYTKIESYVIKCLNGAEMTINKDGTIVMNGGGFGGLVKVMELVTRLNVVEQTLATVTTTIKTIPAANGSPLNSSIDVFTQQTSTEDIANNNVTHG